MRLPDGTYWLSLHDSDKAETRYAGYRRVQARFVDGKNAISIRFERCSEYGQHSVAYFGLSYTKDGTPFEFVSLTCTTCITANVWPACAARMVSIEHDEVGR